MRKSLRVITNILILFFALGCDMGLQKRQVDNPDTKRKQDRLEKLGETLGGVYRGSLNHTDGNTYKVEIRLFTKLENVGRDENGEIKTLPKLQGQIRYEDFVNIGDEALYEVKFNENGVFKMIYTQKPNNTTSDSIIDILSHVEGNWKNGVITAVWQGYSAEIGHLNLTRTSLTVPVVDNIERNKRYQRVFTPLQNTYFGVLNKLKPKDEFDRLFTTAKITISYDVADGINGLTINLKFKDDVLPPVNNALINWDGRTQEFKVVSLVSALKLSLQGVLNKDKIEFDQFKIGTLDVDFEKASEEDMCLSVESKMSGKSYAVSVENDNKLTLMLESLKVLRVDNENLQMSGKRLVDEKKSEFKEVYPVKNKIQNGIPYCVVEQGEAGDLAISVSEDETLIGVSSYGLNLIFKEE